MMFNETADHMEADGYYRVRLCCESNRCRFAVCGSGNSLLEAQLDACDNFNIRPMLGAPEWPWSTPELFPWEYAPVDPIAVKPVVLKAHLAEKGQDDG